jgi:hypothetical protein
MSLIQKLYDAQENKDLENTMKSLVKTIIGYNTRQASILLERNWVNGL